MNKFALSVKKDFDPYKITLSELLKKEAFLDDRTVCETNKEQLQIIPYITFVDISTGIHKYFTYMRGQGSGESRLTGNVSIGIGGHVEEEPKGTTTLLFKEIEKSLAYVIANGAKLECHEEVGMQIPLETFLKTLGDNGNIVRQTLGESTISLFASKDCVLYNELNDVSCVHLGINIAIMGTTEDFKTFGFGTMEEGIITKGQWLTLVELTTPPTEENTFVLEEWSLQVIKNLQSENSITLT